MINEYKCSYIKIVQENINKKGIDLSKIVGHKKQKDELVLLINWFKNNNFYKSIGVEVPKGVLLFGEPGNGKSLLIKEIVSQVGIPTFIFNGNVENIPHGLEEVFLKAREEESAIIVIDELDLLISKDDRITRVLQDNIDGINNNNNVLVLCATNNYNDIPEPLIRHGRIEKVLNISSPKNGESLELLKKLFNEYKIELITELDDKVLSSCLRDFSFATVKSIFNDIILRNGTKNITFDMIINSIFEVSNKIKNNEDCYYEYAVHEAGHAVMAMKFPHHFEIGRLSIGDGGYLSVIEKNSGFWSYSKLIADIKISYAGVIAQKIILKEGSKGCENDMQRAYLNAEGAINKYAYHSCHKTLPIIHPYKNMRIESEKRKIINERKIERLLKRCEKEVIRYIKKNKIKVIKLANALFEKKNIYSSEVIRIINER